MHALAGLRVLDFSHLLPGPWCTQTLGDLGADVVKVERRDVGDPSRFNPPAYREGTVYFHSVNRNKRSIDLDLGAPGDRQIARDLAEDADVVVESFRPGTAAKLGVDYASLHPRNPRLVYCSLSGFGPGGALASTAGHDAGIQGLAGLLSADDGALPRMPRFQAADYAAASFATIAILAALLRRASTGEGCVIEVPMYDSLMAWSSITLSSALARAAGHSGTPRLESFGSNPRYAVYATRDGKAVVVALLEARAWHRFCEHLGRPDLVHPESPGDRHRTHPERSESYRAAIAAFCGARDRDELIAEMEAHDIAITPCHTPDEALASSVARERDVVAFHDHPREGRVPHFVDPLMRAGLSDPSRRSAPVMGEHRDEILAELAGRRRARDATATHDVRRAEGTRRP